LDGSDNTNNLAFGAPLYGNTNRGIGMWGKGAAPPITAGRVVLAVPDASMVDFFQQQFAMLGAPIDLVPAMGIDALIQVCIPGTPGPGYTLHPLLRRCECSSGEHPFGEEKGAAEQL
jgi:hypothetical protein